MRKFLLTLKYHGASFVGWQVQTNGYSVQTCLQDAIETIFGKRVDVTGCSRTDSGVHAEGYQMTFEMDTDRPIERITLALNAVLPETVSVWDCKEVPPDFHPRYSAKGKEYIYRLYDGMAPDPFLNGLAYHCKAKLDDEKMRQAGAYLLGFHDFRSFMAGGSKIVDTRREIYWLDIIRQERNLEIRVCGNGFLYHMVRIIVGTLIAVGRGRMAPEDMRRVLEACDRRSAGHTAPAHGLYLHKVFYQTPQKEES